MAAFAMRANVRHHDLHAVHYAAEIDAERAIPVVEFRIVRRTAAANTGIVAEHVDLAERLDDLARAGTQLIALRNIGLQEINGIRTRQKLARSSEVRIVEIDEGHLHALGEEIAHHAKADA